MALAAWYENEAARLRQKAKEMDQMVEEYWRDPRASTADDVPRQS